MDGIGLTMVNAFTERLRRTVKYEKVFAGPGVDESDPVKMLQEYFNYYPTKRRPQGADRPIPKEVYVKKVKWKEAA